MTDSTATILNQLFSLAFPPSMFFYQRQLNNIQLSRLFSVIKNMHGLELTG